MTNILVTGNGFDIYHGLSTRYYDFVQFEPSCVIEYDENKKITSSSYIKFLQTRNFYYESNPFMKYFCNACKINDNWIDCESEIEHILKFFSEIFIKMKENTENGIKYKTFNELDRHIIQCFKKYFSYQTSSKSYIKMNKKYYSDEYNILKKDLILKDLREDLSDLINGLTFYLNLIVNESKISIISEQIVQIGKIDYLINFNYTSTYKIYGIKDEDVLFLHGKLSDISSIVLGIPDTNELDSDFIWFKKYFQRIQKHNKILDYNIFTEKTTGDGLSDVNVYFFGMSMGRTDGEIITEIINHANFVKIFYYNQQDFESKVKNISEIFGGRYIESAMSNGTIEFIELQKPKKI